MPSYALREALASERAGHDKWFKQMTAIGPMTTSVSAERAVFDSRQTAMQSPAYRHMLSCYEVVEVGADA